MKIRTIAMIGFIVLSAIFLTVGIIVGENQSQEIAMIQRTEAYLNNLCQMTGYKNLGIIDGYAVSQETGCLYNGRAVDERLFEQNGMAYTPNQWDFFISETDDGATIWKKVIYKGDEPHEPILQQEVEAIYLYGML